MAGIKEIEEIFAFFHISLSIIGIQEKEGKNTEKLNAQGSQNRSSRTKPQRHIQQKGTEKEQRCKDTLILPVAAQQIKGCNQYHTLIIRNLRL